MDLGLKCCVRGGVGERKVQLTVCSGHVRHLLCSGGGFMRLVARWGGALAVSAVGFGLTWWVCQELIGADEGISLGIAGAVLAVLLAVAAWWAPRGADSGRAESAGREQVSPVREETGNVTNEIGGGTFSGPVLQGRDFTGLTFGAAPPAPSRPGDPDAG
jgi:hypothetical protein